VEPTAAGLSTRACSEAQAFANLKTTRNLRKHSYGRTALPCRQPDDVKSIEGVIQSYLRRTLRERLLARSPAYLHSNERVNPLLRKTANWLSAVQLAGQGPVREPPRRSSRACPRPRSVRQITSSFRCTGPCEAQMPAIPPRSYPDQLSLLKIDLPLANRAKVFTPEMRDSLPSSSVCDPISGGTAMSVLDTIG